MGKGSNPLAPMNKLVGTLDPVAKQTNKAVHSYTGIDPTREDEGLQKKQQQPSINWGNNGTSSRTIATTSKQGKIKKVYDKKDEKR